VVSGEGQAVVLALHETSRQLTLIKTRIGELPGRAKSPFLAVCLYRDYSGPHNNTRKSSLLRH
jgi:hypothetical protein